MSSSWAIFLQVFFPPPLVFLALLCVPLPRALGFLRKGVLKLVDAVLFLTVGAIPLIAVMGGVSIVVFLLQVVETQRARASEEKALDGITRDRARTARFRAERNFWMSLLAATLWFLLWKVRTLMNEVQQLRRRLAHAE